MSRPPPTLEPAQDPILPFDPMRWVLDIAGLHLRLAVTGDDLAQVQALRAARFLPGSGTARDEDQFDRQSLHLVVIDPAQPDAPLRATARLRLLSDAPQILGSYTGQFYDLSRLARSGLRCLEIGRICRAAEADAQDLPRALLAGLTDLACATQADVLMGCASFHEADPARHAGALAKLKRAHIGPEALRPGRRAPEVIEFPEGGATDVRQIPSLLRLYLSLGGWVSDHAVRDAALDTLHVFTAVEVDKIPDSRRRMLEALTQR